MRSFVVLVALGSASGCFTLLFGGAGGTGPEATSSSSGSTPSSSEMVSSSSGSTSSSSEIASSSSAASPSSSAGTTSSSAMATSSSVTEPPSSSSAASSSSSAGTTSSSLAASSASVPSSSSAASRAAGDVCETAIPLDGASTLTNVSMGGMQPDYGVSPDWAITNCAADNLDGPDRVYTIGVPDGGHLNVQVTPTGGWDVAVFVVAGDCGRLPQDLRACKDNNGAGATEGLQVDSVGGQQVFIVVSTSEDTLTGAAFDLSVSFP